MKTKILLLAALLSTAAFSGAKNARPASVDVMSYNIRQGGAKDGTNSWEFRAPASYLMIDDQKPDIFGVQEALYNQVYYLDQCLADYNWYGLGREDGKKKGEIMAVFYNKKNIKVLKKGTYWLSDTPDTPSLGWDAKCFRTATWVLAKDKRSGKKFFFVNTHLDHVGLEARKNGLQLVIDNIGKMNPKGLPMVLCGDFNMTLDHASMQPVKDAMANARETAVVTDHEGTYQAWGKKEPRIIDYIFYKGFSSCPRFETVRKPYMDRTYISDHFPIKATLLF